MGRDLEMDPTNRNSPTSPTKTPANAVLNKSNKKEAKDKNNYYIEGDSSDEYGPNYP